eukprot:UN02913
MWAFGCMFAGIIFGKNYFFHGKDFPAQLQKIIQCLGRDKFNQFIAKYKIKVPRFAINYRHYSRKKWRKYIDAKTNKKFLGDNALDLLDRLLRFDPNERLTAKEAMKHKYFDKVRHINVESKGYGK